MTLPNLLLTEARRGFQTCAKQYRARRQQSQTFRTLQPLLKKRNSRSAREVAPPPRLEVTKTNEALATRVPPQSDPDHVPTEESGSSRELITKPSKPSSVSEIKRADVPMKIIPKAQITPELTLTPKERLQIEFLTRRPPRAEEKKSTFLADSRIELRKLISSSLQRKIAYLPWRNFQDQFSLNRQSIFSAGYVWFYLRRRTSILCVWISLVDRSTPYVPVTSDGPRC